jgi:hypothetical protein
MNARRLTLLALLILAAQGCTSGHRTLSLSIPDPDNDHRPAKSRGTACVVSVADRRMFQNRPPNPSTPTIDGDVDDLTPEQRARMIGRQRNKYGRAQGDIALSGGDTVPHQVRLLVETALRRRGYDVVADPAAAQTTVDVTVDRFWAWCNPAPWFTLFEARIDCRVTLTRPGARTRTFRASGHGLNPGQVPADRNWQQTYERAYRDFLEDLEDELD